MDNRGNPGELRPIWAQYAFSLLALAAALGVRQLLDPFLGERLAFTIFYPAIAFAAYYGGLGPALMVLFLGGLGADYLFLAPRHALGDFNVVQILELSFYGVAGLVIAVFGAIMRDAQLHAQSKSYESQQAQLRLNRTLESIGDCFYTLDREWRFTYVNRHAEEHFQRSGESLLGRVFWDVLPMFSGTTWQQEHERAMTQQAPLRIEGLSPLTRRWVETNVFPYPDGVAVYFRDITLRKEAEELLQRRARKSAALAELSQVALAKHELQTVFDRAMQLLAMTLPANRVALFELIPEEENCLLRAGIGWPERSVGHIRVPCSYDSEAGFTLFGTKPVKRGESLVYEPLLVPDFSVETRFTPDAWLVEQGVKTAISVVVPGRETAYGVLSVHATRRQSFTNADAEFLHTIANVLAEAIQRHRAEEALRESETRLRTAIDAGNLGVWEWNIPENRLTWSERLLAFHRLKPEDFGGTLESFTRLVHPDDLHRVEGAIRRTLEENAPYDLEFRTQLAGGEARWIKTSARILFDEQGKPLRMLGGAIDLTEIKRLEELLRFQATQLEEIVQERTVTLQETIVELESLSYTIVHDLRAPLRAMHSFSAFLLEEYQERLDEGGRDYLRRIEQSATRMDRLITDVLSYSKLTHAKFELAPVEVAKLVGDILESYPDFQFPKADIAIQGPLPSALGNEAFLTQCFSNLIGNAIKFVQPGTVPHVRVYAERKGDFIRYCVEDRGIGIPTEFQDKIFGFFQRLSTAYEGTGMGLAIVRKAVEKMGGTLGLESELGKGSTFWFELKAVKELS